MPDDYDGHSLEFTRYASRLERHLRKNGISCRDADLIIEESSELYFDKLRSVENRFFRLVRKPDLEKHFVDSACVAIERRIPEAKSTFGSRSEIARCIHWTG